MGQAPLLPIQLLDVPRRQAQAFEFLDLEAQQVQARRPLRPLGEEGAQPVLPGAVVAKEAGQFPDLAGLAGVAVQELALGGGAQQGLVGMLAMDVHQVLAQGLELVAAGESTVDVGPGTAAGRQQAADGAIAIAVAFLRQVLLHQPVPGRGHGGQVEAGRHLGPLATRPDHARVGPVPQGEAQGVDEDGFTGPGLAGEGGHARAQFKFQGADHGQVLNEDMAQHGVPLLLMAG